MMNMLISKKLTAGFAIAIAAIIANAVISYNNIQQLVQNEQLVTHTNQVLRSLESTLSTLKDAETGQRGYLLTGAAEYLQPYESAIASLPLQLQFLKQLTADHPAQQQRAVELEQQFTRKLAELQETIALYHTQSPAAAEAVVHSGRGKQIMDDIRQQVAEMETTELVLLRQRAQASQSSLQRTTATAALAVLSSLGLLALLALLMRRDIATRQQVAAALQAEKSNLELRVAERTAELLQGNQRLQHELHERQQIQTDLQISQAQFAGILDIAEDAIISINAQQQITLFNQGAEKIFGYTAAEVMGQSLDLLLPDRFAQAHRQHVTDFKGSTVPARRMGERCELFGRRRNGVEFPAEASISKLDSGTGTVFTVFLRDITERQQIDRMKDEFVSVVSHELRTPLTAIHGSLGMLASGLLKPESDQGKRMLQIAVDSSDRLVRLINDILDIERIESGRVKMAKAHCQMDDLIRAAVNVVQTLADNTGVTLSVATVPVQLWADPDRIIQTLTNLLSNAIKFSPAGHTVWLTVQRQADQLLLTIKDQGRGIPTDKLDSIFEWFQQVDSSDARNHEGTGLGLAICRSIMQQHDGKIWAESILGEGSTFSLTLPIQERWQTSPAGTQETAATPPLILLCDDDPTLRTVLQERLEQQHYRVITVTSGPAAIAQAIGQHPDVILLNLLLPEMNGWETLSQLKEQPATQNIPIIVCNLWTNTPLVVYSARDLEAADRDRFKVGPAESLNPEPVAIADFEQRIMTLLQKVIQAQARPPAINLPAINPAELNRPELNRIETNEREI